MAIFEIEGPDGKIYEIDAPDQGAAIAAFKKFTAAPATGPDGMTTAERIAAAKAGTLAPPSPERLAAAAAADEAALAGMQPEPSMVGDLLKSGASGVARGTAGLIGLPGTAAELLNLGLLRGGQAIGLLPEEWEPIPNKLSSASLIEGMGKLTGGATDYEAQTTPGKYAGTVGEFLPGALLGGLPGMGRRALAYGVAPGLTSEAAGQLTEGTAAEPYARAGTALATALLMGRPGAFQGDDEATRLANSLRESGVRGITTGQAKGSVPLMRLEGMLAPTARQGDDFNAIVLRRFGSDAKAATPTVLRGIERNIVGQMDDAVRGADIIPSASHATNALKVADDYVQRVPAGSLTPRVEGIAKEIRAMAVSGKPIALDRLKTWRSDIGKLTVSPDAPTREAAHALRGLIDDMTDAALTTAGRADDITKLAVSREAYRDFIGVRDAASRAGAEAGALSPTQLNQSMIRAQGREAYATGRSTPMTELTRAGAAVLRPAPATLPGGTRTISDVLPLVTGALGSGAGLAGGPLGAALGGAAGLAAPALGQAAMRSAPVQALLRDPKAALMNIGRTIPGLLAQ
jgi:hypothetical protein